MAALYKRGIRVHASCVLVGEGAVLVRGPAGSGKTALCLALIEQAQRIGVFSRLVADDACWPDRCRRSKGLSSAGDWA
jgi:serine kinase of HPr protein (carbohydrate metabolism regulator)